MRIAIALFDRFKALDSVGPYEVLSRLPGAEAVFVGREKRIFRTDIGALALLAGADRRGVLSLYGLQRAHDAPPDRGESIAVTTASRRLVRRCAEARPLLETSAKPWTGCAIVVRGAARR